MENYVATTTCDQCSGPLGAKYYSDVPGKGNLCLVCHKVWYEHRMKIGDYDAINEPVYHWDQVLTRKDLEEHIAKQGPVPKENQLSEEEGVCTSCFAPLGDPSVAGTCAECSLHAGNPPLEPVATQCSNCGTAVQSLNDGNLCGACYDEHVMARGTIGESCKQCGTTTYVLVTSSGLCAMCHKDDLAKRGATWSPQDAAQVSKAIAESEDLRAAGVKYLQAIRDGAESMASAMSGTHVNARMREALKQIQCEVDRLDCVELSMSYIDRTCLDADEVEPKDYCARCAILHWATKGLAHD